LITIPAGILQPPFFHDKYTEASAYATIGWVIAHELSHSEDANGILYDKDGALQNTWNETMLRKYTNRFARIVKEYDSPEGCNHENYGMQTLSENIADINGLRLAYEALFLDGTSTATTMADKREFFMAAAQMWCASYTQEALCDRSRDDVHAIAPYRVDMTYSHVPYFAEAHGCPVGSRMHRHAGERIVLFGQEANDYIAARRRKKRSPKK
jgi:predicted metalloendopeptidase